MQALQQRVGVQSDIRAVVSADGALDQLRGQIGLATKPKDGAVLVAKFGVAKSKQLGSVGGGQAL